MKKTLLLKLFTLTTCLLLSQGLWAQKFPFRNQFPLPPTISGTTFNLSVEQNSTHIFDPDSTMGDTFVAPLKTYGYKSSNLQPAQQMDYLGPTLLWTQGTPLNINIQNNLAGHETTVHWHGLNLPAMMDGGPHEVIAAPGQPGMNPWMPNFTVIDPIQTVWYHSHLMDSTTEQVTMGLAGMIIVQDTVTDNVWDSLPHQYGVNDIPVVIQEKGFVISGGKANSLLATNQPGNTPYTLINGVFNPYKKIPAQVVRLRLLNGSARKSYQLGISDVLKNPASADFETMYLAATDGGYTQMTYPMDSLLISPGERMEMLVNFTGMHGDTFYLNNLVRSVPLDIVIGKGNPPSPHIYGNAFMAFIVDSNIKPATPFTRVPTMLVPSYSVDTITTPIFKRRIKNLVNTSGSPSGGGPWTIDSIGMDMQRLDDTILVNSMEMWTIKNLTNISHPFHIHKVQFQVVSYTGAIGAGNVNNDTTYVFQLPANPGPKVKLLPTYMRGYKDDVLVRAGASMTFVARFDSFPSMRDTATMQLDTMDGFMYHCHILTHEDDNMMHQFIVVDAATYYNWPMGVSSPKNEAFVLYPNPAGDVLNLKGNINNASHIRLVDVLGRTLKEQELTAFNGQLQIQVGDLPRGLVFVELSSGNTRSVQKVYLR